MFKNNPHIEKKFSCLKEMVPNMSWTFYPWFILISWLLKKKIGQGGLPYPLLKTVQRPSGERCPLPEPTCRAHWGTQRLLRSSEREETLAMETGQTLPSGSTGQVGAASGTLALCAEFVLRGAGGWFFCFSKRWLANMLGKRHCLE